MEPFRQTILRNNHLRYRRFVDLHSFLSICLHSHETIYNYRRQGYHWQCIIVGGSLARTKNSRTKLFRNSAVYYRESPVTRTEKNRWVMGQGCLQHLRSKDFFFFFCHCVIDCADHTIRKKCNSVPRKPFTKLLIQAQKKFKAEGGCLLFFCQDQSIPHNAVGPNI